MYTRKGDDAATEIRTIDLGKYDEIRDGRGLGDTVNGICAIPEVPSVRWELAEGPCTWSIKIRDMIATRDDLSIVQESSGQDYTEWCASAQMDPEQRTRLRISETEQQKIRGLLSGTAHVPNDYIVICTNRPVSYSEIKTLSVDDWVGFVKEYRGDADTVVMMPTFDSWDSDVPVQNAINRELSMNVINLQDLLVRQRLPQVRQSQHEFGLDRNDHGLNFLQDAALYAVLLNQDFQGLFQDSSPVHIASAVSGKRVVADKVVDPCYRPRNGGVARSFLPKGTRYKRN